MLMSTRSPKGTRLSVFHIFTLRLTQLHVQTRVEGTWGDSVVVSGLIRFLLFFSSFESNMNRVCYGYSHLPVVALG